MQRCVYIVKNLNAKHLCEKIMVAAEIVSIFKANLALKRVNVRIKIIR